MPGKEAPKTGIPITKFKIINPKDRDIPPSSVMKPFLLK